MAWRPVGGTSRRRRWSWPPTLTRPSSWRRPRSGRSAPRCWRRRPRVSFLSTVPPIRTGVIATGGSWRTAVCCWAASGTSRRRRRSATSRSPATASRTISSVTCRRWASRRRSRIAGRASWDSRPTPCPWSVRCPAGRDSSSAAGTPDTGWASLSTPPGGSSGCCWTARSRPPGWRPRGSPGERLGSSYKNSAAHLGRFSRKLMRNPAVLEMASASALAIEVHGHSWILRARQGRSSAEVTGDADTLAAILDGRRPRLKAFLDGHIHVRGRLALAVQLNTLGLDRVHLVGNSLGARVALEVAMKAPERVDRLVLLAAAPIVHRLRQLVPLVRLLRPELAAIPIPMLRAEALFALRGLFAKPSRMPDEWLEAAADEFVRVFRDPGARVAFFSSLREIYLEEPHGDLGYWNRLQSVSAPALFVWGDHDPLVPPAPSRAST